MRRMFRSLLTIQSQDEDIRRRGSTVVLVALGLIVVDLLLLPMSLSSKQGIGEILLPVTGLIFVSALLLARAGRVALGSSLIIATVLLSGLASMLASKTPSFSMFYLSLGLIMASLTLNPWQVGLVLVINLLGTALALDRMPQATLLSPNGQGFIISSTLFQVMVAVMGILGASALKRTMRELQRARAQLAANTTALAHTNRILEEQVAARSSELRETLEQMQQQLAERARLLSENTAQRTAIREMNVPVLPVSNTTMVMPLVGTLDDARLSELQLQALQIIAQTKMRSLVLDITGVVVVDDQVVEGIMGVVRAARLLGTEVILVGVRPEMAQAIVELELSFSGIRTFSTLKAALRQQIRAA